MGHAMEWLGLHFITELTANGQVILNCTHDPFLVLLAYLVACVGRIDCAIILIIIESRATGRAHVEGLDHCAAR